jgi:hypothetical protein
MQLDALALACYQAVKMNAVRSKVSTVAKTWHEVNGLCAGQVAKERRAAMRKAEEVAAGAHPAGGLAAINPAELFQVLLLLKCVDWVIAHVAQHWHCSTSFQRVPPC